MSLQMKVTLDIGHFVGPDQPDGSYLRGATVVQVTVRINGAVWSGQGSTVRAPSDLMAATATEGEAIALGRAIAPIPRLVQGAVWDVWRGAKPRDTDEWWRRITRRVTVSQAEVTRAALEGDFAEMRRAVLERPGLHPAVTNRS